MGQKVATLELQILTDIARLQKDMRDMQRATDAATTAVQAGFGRAGAAYDMAGSKASAFSQRAQIANDNAVAAARASQDMATRINALTGVTSSGMRRSADDIAAYGAELDRLRAKYNPVFSAIQNYRSAQEEIRRAHAVGAISADEMSAAIGRERRATLDGIAAIKARNLVQEAANDATIRSTEGNRQFAMQMSQVGQQVLAGTGFVQAFAMQLPDIAVGLGAAGGKATGFAAVLGGPLGIGLTTAAALAVSFGMSLFDAEDALQKVEWASNGVSDAQGILGNVMDLTTGKINTQSTALVALAQAQILVNKVDAQKRAAEARRDVQAIQDRPVELQGSMMGVTAGRRNVDARDTISQQVLEGALDGKTAVQRLDNLRKAGVLTDEQFSKAASAVANLGLELENIKSFDEADALLNGTGGTSLLKPEKVKKPKTDTHAESLLRDAAATEAMIAGLNDLTDAYLASDQAAVRAEITAKATEQGIKKRADLEAYVAQQIRLVAAQRTADGAKSVADMRQQSDAQQLVNNQMEQGMLTSEEASQFLKDEAQLRPLIAVQALAEGAAKEKLTAVIAALRDEQKRSNDETARGQSLARAEQIRAQTAAAQAQNASDAQFGAQRLGILSSDMNYAQQAEALRQLNVEQEKRNILLAAENAIRNLPHGATDSEIQAINEKAQADVAAVDMKAQIDAASDSLTTLHDLANDIDFASIFGSGGQAISDMVSAMDKLNQAQAAYNLLKDSDDDTVRQKAAQDYAKAKVAGTTKILGASKMFFKQESAGYKIITAAEKVLAALEMANTIKSMVLDTTKTASSVANSAVRGAADQASGAAKIFSELGPWGFPVVAAMVAVLAGLGLGGGGGGSSGPSIPSAEDMQAAAGAGSVLGDASAKSNSIANSLEIVAANTNDSLEYSNSMLSALRAIETGISKMAGTVAQQISVSGSMFDTSKLNLGSSGSSGVLGIGGSSTTKTLWDMGLDLESATVANIIDQGIEGRTYQIVQKIKKSNGVLGIGGGTKTSYKTTYGTVDEDITSAIGDVMESIRTSLITGANSIGLTGADAIIDSFEVELGRISFMDMTGEEIEDQLNAIFSKVGDDLAGAVLPSLTGMQQVGEGLYETFMRVIAEYQTVDVELRSIGLTFGAVGVSSLAARDSLVQLFGSLDEFVSQTDYYRENFLTDAEQMAPVITAVADEMARLGLSSVDTIDKFKAVVNGLDLTTDAGQAMYAALLGVAQAFNSVEEYQAKLAEDAQDLADKRASLEISLLKAQGDATGALALQRQAELAAMDESLRSLQEQVYLATDIASAKDDLSTAYKREAADLQTTIDKFQNLSDTLKDFRATLVGSTDDATTYRSALVKMMEIGGLASGGDADALAGFSATANTFLEAAKNNAGSLQQYQRDVALTLRYTDQAIGGADTQVTIAEQQLAAMQDQVGALIDINDSVETVVEALAKLEALLSGSSTAAVSTVDPEQAQADRDTAQANHEEMKGLMENSVVAVKQQLRLLRGVTRSGTSIAIVTDADTPLATTSS